MKRLIFLFCLAIGVASAQDTSYFRIPVDHQVKMSGSFGELRTNHFHAGIDIKSSKGVSGDPIYAAAEGYVSRIKVQYGGYGNALYIDHPNGYTTVYAHLDKFDPVISDYVKSMQLKGQSYEVDLYPEQSRFYFEKGAYIGNMGNTGRSYGPHLHFEIRKTAEELPINPYLFNLGAPDSKNPVLYSVSLVGFDDIGNIVSQSNHKLTHQGGGVFGPVKQFKSEGKRLGVEIQAFDQMDGANNLNGVYDVKMYVDDSLYYHHVMNEVPFHLTRHINTHIDYQEKKDNNRTLIRCFTHPGNQLEFYTTNDTQGLINLSSDVEMTIKIEVSDYFGNLSTYSFTTIGLEGSQDIKPSYQKLVKQGEPQIFDLYGVQFNFQSGSLERDLYFNIKEQKHSKGINYILGSSNTPILHNVNLKIDVSHIDSTHWNQLILLHSDGNRLISYGGVVDNGKLDVDIDRFGKFKVTMDTIPPKITNINFKTNVNRNNNFKFKIEDGHSTRAKAKDVKMDVYIDGIWHIANYNVLNHTLNIPLKDVPPGTHELYVVAVDHSGNRSQITKTFKLQ